jgi:tetratricopeptide (TPR) repeat protein
MDTMSAGLGGAGGSPSSPGYAAVASVEEAELKHKEGKCYVALEDAPNAIRAMEAVPPPLRPLPLNLLLGKVHMGTGPGSKASALRAYRDALKQEPTALEAIGPLVAMGVGAAELKQLMGGGGGAPAAGNSGVAQGARPPPLGWVDDLVDGLCGAQANDVALAARAFGRLDAQFPANLASLLELGKLHAGCGRWDAAAYYFTKARISDTLNVDAMDDFALLVTLRHAGVHGATGGGGAAPPAPPTSSDGAAAAPASAAAAASSAACCAELNRLAHDLVGVCPARPEPWVAVALFQDAKGDRTQALAFVDKALACAPRHALAHALKGQLLLARGEPEPAIVCYFKAKELKRDLRSYTGLVEAYLAAGKLREAAAAAKEASVALHASPAAWTLLGRVLASPAASAADQARAAALFRRALAAAPGCVDAARSLAALHAAGQRWADAADVLRASLSCHHASAFLHAQLADVLTSAGQHADALAHWHTALALNPHHAGAKAGLERLEKLMRGADPGATDEHAESGEDDHSGEGSTEGSGASSQYM